MNEKEIITQLLINKYKNIEVTVELVKRIEKEAKEISEKYRKSNIPDYLPDNQIV